MTRYELYHVGVSTVTAMVATASMFIHGDPVWMRIAVGAAVAFLSGVSFVCGRRDERQGRG